MKSFIKPFLFFVFSWSFTLLSQSISIVSPANNSTFIAGSSIYVNVSFKNLQYRVTKIVLYDSATFVFEDSIVPFGYVRKEIEPGFYRVTAKAFLSNGDSIISDTVHVTIIGCTPGGSIYAEGFSNIPGSEVSDLTNSPNFPNNPDVVASLNKFEYGPGYGDSYGARTRGYICAPATGYYTFYIAGDDQDGLWLSTDENPGNKVLIAYNESHVKWREWYKFPTQQSAPIKLVKGVRYYIETLHKQVIGPNYLTVAWQIPGGTFEAPIPGSRLSPYVSTMPGIVITSDFTAAMKKISMQKDTVEINSFKIIAAPNPSQDYFTLYLKTGSNEQLYIIVTDITGRIVEQTVRVSKEGSITFGKKLSKGMYVVKVIQGAKTQVLKVFKQ